MAAALESRNEIGNYGHCRRMSTCSTSKERRIAGVLTAGDNDVFASLHTGQRALERNQRWFYRGEQFLPIELRARYLPYGASQFSGIGKIDGFYRVDRSLANRLRQYVRLQS